VPPGLGREVYALAMWLLRSDWPRSALSSAATTFEAPRVLPPVRARVNGAPEGSS